ncbi:MAG TPA: hypothetical protein VMR81_05645 [Patescibacteria group bacterium]|nr:hypothetical protein [Patescibacteria group bacterium]
MTQLPGVTSNPLKPSGRELSVGPVYSESQFDQEIRALQSPDFYHSNMVEFIQNAPPQLTKVRPFPRPIDRLIIGATADHKMAVQADWLHGEFLSDLILYGKDSGPALLGIASGEIFLNRDNPERRMVIFTYNPDPWYYVTKLFGRDNNAVKLADLRDNIDMDGKFQYLAKLLSSAHPDEHALSDDWDGKSLILVIDQIDRVFQQFPAIQKILGNWPRDTRGMTTLLASAETQFGSMMNPSLNIARKVADPLIFAVPLVDGDTTRLMPFRVYPPVDIGMPLLTQ